MQAKLISVSGGYDIQSWRYGNKEQENTGKTLVVTAGVHGCEYVGVQAVLALMRELEVCEEQLCGTVILVPIVNESGFYEGAKRIVPEDGENLNRAFPGREDGTLSARMAAAVERELYAEADFILDLHSGDVNERLTPLVFYPVAGEPAVNEAAKRVAEALDMPYRVASTAKNGLYSWAVQSGIPALLLERGCQGQWSTEEVRACADDVYRVMHHLGIWKEARGEKAHGEKAHGKEGVQQAITRASYIEAPVRGLWYPQVQEGQFIRQGTVLGELRTLQGELIEQYRAEFDGVVLYYTVSLGVIAGDSLVAFGEVAW